MMNVGITASPLPSGLPHVAYVLLWYPLFTQPFIFREVEELRKILPLQVYTLYDKNLRHCSEEMKKCASHAKTHGIKKVPAIIGDMCAQTGVNPLLVAKLFRRALCFRWNSLETFAENLWAFCAGIGLGRQFLEDGIDMAYAPWPRGAATAAWVGASIARIPFAMAARGDNLNPADSDLGAKFSAAAFVRANNAADMERIKNFAQGQAGDKTILLYNSLTLPANSAPVSDQTEFRKPLHILALGRFDVTKGFDILLQACAILKEKGFAFRLTLAGGGGKVMGLGNLEEKLRDMRKSLGLEELVNMPGLVSHDELPDILRRHDIFVAPCVIHASGRRDGIPNTVIEAMAYGLPVVSTNVNALPEIVRDGETGITVKPGDAEALANAIIKLAQNPAKARAMGSNAARLAREIFDPAANARTFANIFIEFHRNNSPNNFPNNFPNNSRKHFREKEKICAE